MPYKDPAKEQARQKTKYRVLKETKPFVHRCWCIKSKCVQFELPFDLTPEYLERIWTGFCAISGQPIDLRGYRTNPLSAELDRFTPELGYVQTNVAWVSKRMNLIKWNATPEELELVYKYITKKSLKEEYGPK